jgi:hypothetical protein
MKFDDPPCDDDVSKMSATSDPRSLIGALRVSRRIQAARAIRHYRHLLHDNCDPGTKAEFAARVFAKGVASMPTDLNQQRAPRSGASLSFNAKVSIAAVILGFGLLHVIGGVMLHGPATPRGDDNKMPIARGD